MEISKIPPIPLILFAQDSRTYTLAPEAQKLFASIPSHHSIAVITILGPYRTGKSLLLNRILLSKSQGFQVGNTVNACTKGLWFYTISGKDFIKGLGSNESAGITEDTTVLLIDTEGFGSVNVNQNYDNRVFLMALLLSSLVIYNSMGTIDENALNQLALITSLSNEIQSKLDAPITMPYFIWILRDFMLKLEDKNGNKISSKDYLENSLEVQKGVSELIEKKNKVRRMFNHYFPERDCVTLMRPMEDEDELGRLNELDDDKLRKEFVDQMQFLKIKILKKTCSKTILIDSKSKHTKPIIGGNMFMSLCNSFLEVINEGKITKIENIWTMVSSNEAQKAVGRSLEAFDKIRERVLNSYNTKELGKDGLIECKKIINKEILALYMEKIKHLELHNQEGLLKNLMEGIAERFIKFEKENKTNWLKKYEVYMENEIEKFENLSLEYENYFDFREDLQRFEERFYKEMQGGLKKKTFFLKIALKLWIKYIENYIRKHMNDHKKYESQKHETMELIKLMKKTSADNNQKNENEADKKELSRIFELLQTQLSESKQVQDQILTSIKDQKEKEQNQSLLLPPPQPQIIYESPKTPSPPPVDEKLMETNKYLTMALQRLEGQYKEQEKKLKKYREFKKSLSLAAYIECAQCHSLFKPIDFIPHANTCKVIQKPLLESPDMTMKYDFQTNNFYQINDSTSTTYPQNRGTTSLLPNFDHLNVPNNNYASQLNRDLTIYSDRMERDERKTKSFFESGPANPMLDDFDDDDTSDLIYNMPRPLPGPKKEIRVFNKEESEVLVSHDENHHKDLNLPFNKQGVATSNYWQTPMAEIFGKKQQNNVGVEKIEDFNMTLIPDGEIKTMSYVKKKSKGSSKGSNSNGNGHEGGEEQQGTKGLTQEQKEYFDRRKSWNSISIKSEFLKKNYE